MDFLDMRFERQWGKLPHLKHSSSLNDVLFYEFKETVLSHHDLTHARTPFAEWMHVGPAACFIQIVTMNEEMDSTNPADTDDLLQYQN